VSGQLHAPAALPPGKEPRYPPDRSLGGSLSRSGRGGEKKNYHPRRDSNSRPYTCIISVIITVTRSWTVFSFLPVPASVVISRSSFLIPDGFYFIINLMSTSFCRYISFCSPKCWSVQIRATWVGDIHQRIAVRNPCSGLSISVACEENRRYTQ
jgi:hypothetical protein